MARNPGTPNGSGTVHQHHNHHHGGAHHYVNHHGHANHHYNNNGSANMNGHVGHHHGGSSNNNHHNNNEINSTRHSRTQAIYNGGYVSIPYRLRVQPRARENIASTMELFHDVSRVGVFGGLPWKAPDKKYSVGIDGLTEEIEDFFKYIQPNKQEHVARQIVVSRLSKLIELEWPGARLEVFGSFRTGLYLPTGDIDLVIKGDWGQIPPLFDLERTLVNRDICDRTTLRVLDKATVPLIKFRDRDTDIAVDISFNQANCVKAAEFVRHCCLRYPCLPPLTMLLKQFLSERNLNEVFFGGLSSYSLVLMILNFLQMHEDQKEVRSPRANLGSLLLGFLELFGEKFEYDKFGIRIKEGGALMKKEELRREMSAALAGCVNPAQVVPPSHPCMLTIEDPLTPGNDVSRASYSINVVREAFQQAYHALKSGLRDDRDPLHSILGRIIRITDQVVYRRIHVMAIMRQQCLDDESKDQEAFTYSSDNGSEYYEDNKISNNNCTSSIIHNKSCNNNNNNSSCNINNNSSNDCNNNSSCNNNNNNNNNNGSIVTNNNNVNNKNATTVSIRRSIGSCCMEANSRNMKQVGSGRNCSGSSPARRSGTRRRGSAAAAIVVDALTRECVDASCIVAACMTGTDGSAVGQPMATNGPPASDPAAAAATAVASAEDANAAGDMATHAARNGSVAVGADVDDDVVAMQGRNQDNQDNNGGDRGTLDLQQERSGEAETTTTTTEASLPDVAGPNESTTNAGANGGAVPSLESIAPNAKGDESIASNNNNNNNSVTTDNSSCSSNNNNNSSVSGTVDNVARLSSSTAIDTDASTATKDASQCTKISALPTTAKHRNEASFLPSNSDSLASEHANNTDANAGTSAISSNVVQKSSRSNSGSSPGPVRLPSARCTHDASSLTPSLNDRPANSCNSSSSINESSISSSITTTNVNNSQNINNNNTASNNHSNNNNVGCLTNGYKRHQQRSGAKRTKGGSGEPSREVGVPPRSDDFMNEEFDAIILGGRTLRRPNPTTTPAV